jgi:hypothetical protein
MLILREVIPTGNYGAGISPWKKPSKKGHITFVLKEKKLRGRYVLTRFDEGKVGDR